MTLDQLWAHIQRYKDLPGNPPAALPKIRLVLYNFSVKVLLLSDIHGNLEALETVLAAAQDQWEEIWFLGDLVGYGPDPNQCVNLLKSLAPKAVAGNHDYAVLGKLDLAFFSLYAAGAIRWTQKVITPKTREYLGALNATIVEDPFTLVHGSPSRPLTEYIINPLAAAAAFQVLTTPLCLCGHSHIPLVMRKAKRGNIELFHSEEKFSFRGQELILNPGSVGQPRDRDPRAAYALLDTEKATFQIKRVAYDLKRVQEKMRALGAHPLLIERLQFGY